MSEDQLLTDKLESTNEPYAISKIAGIKLCESYNRQYGKSHGIDYRSIMPTNLYGPGDNYHPKNSHVIPGLIYRFHQAKIKNQSSVDVWGSGLPKREFLYVDDMARAAIHLMNLKKKNYDISGPFPADTLFLKDNRKKFDVIVGMYHDQVLTPAKTLYEYDAINVTAGLPFIRVSPDHGPNEQMLGKNKSNHLSILRSIQFLDF